MDTRDRRGEGLRRLDRWRAGPAVGLGLAAGGGVGLLVALSPRPAAALAFAGVLGLATALALTARPVAEETERLPSPGDEWVNPVDGSLLVYVPGGEYTLGAEDLEELFLAAGVGAARAAEWAGCSKPVHRVRLTGFWIARHPVTNAQYCSFLAAQPEQPQPEYWKDDRFAADEQPVVRVSWEEAGAYCRWAGLELPSEAQWEAAARGADGRRYPWGDEPPDEERACFDQDWDSGHPAAVGAHPAGAGSFGTHDQAGNVWEWCLDTWDPAAYAAREGAFDPVNEAGDEGGMRVVRGGSWDDPSRDLASAVRGVSETSVRNRDLGFRCVLSVPAEPGS